VVGVLLAGFLYLGLSKGPPPVRAPEGVKQGAQGVLWAEVVQVARYGARASLLLSGAGLLLAAGLLLLPGVPLAVTGFAFTGLAVAGIVPTTLSAAGRLAPGHSGAVSGGLMAAVYSPSPSPPRWWGGWPSAPPSRPRCWWWA
jgi:hypothetical protein